MSVPLTISQLSTTAALNSPAGSEPVGNNLAPYLNAHAAFIAQLANGSGLTPTVALNMNSLLIHNLAAGVALTDAVNYSQLKNYLPIGAVMMYSGTVANIPAVWGANWAICNGLNGTPNLLNRFVIAAGDQYGPGAYGGTTSYALSVANMPTHSHPLYDPTHAHAVAEAPHSHVVNEQPHAHTMPNGGTGQAGADNGGITAASGPNGYGSRGAQSTNAATTGISIGSAVTGIGIYGAPTGISIGDTGSGAAFTVIPPFYALCYVMKIA